MGYISIAEYNEMLNKGSAGKSKYGNHKTVYNGERYDSKREANYAKQLDTLRNAQNDTERVVKVERQVKYRIEHKDVHICNYVLDFRVTYADGRIEYVDVKGYLTHEYRLKKKLMLAFYGIEIKET